MREITLGEYSEYDNFKKTVEYYPVCVYGSIRKGMRNQRWVDESLLAESLGIGKAKGFTMVSLQYYPAILKGEETDSIVGEVYKIKEEIYQDYMNKLDSFEGGYDRQLVDVKLEAGDIIKAWVYVYNERYSRSRTFQTVPNGDWVEFCKENKNQNGFALR